MADIVKVKIINQSGLPLPEYKTAESAGMDLSYCGEEDITLQPLERKLAKTGIFIELPMGYEAQVRPRSGMALKHGIGVLNSPGTIDSDYRGEIGVIVVNLSNEAYTIKKGAPFGKRLFHFYCMTIKKKWSWVAFTSCQGSHHRSARRHRRSPGHG